MIHHEVVRHVAKHGMTLGQFFHTPLGMVVLFGAFIIMALVTMMFIGGILIVFLGTATAAYVYSNRAKTASDVSIQKFIDGDAGIDRSDSDDEHNRNWAE